METQCKFVTRCNSFPAHHRVYYNQSLARKNEQRQISYAYSVCVMMYNDCQMLRYNDFKSNTLTISYFTYMLILLFSPFD